MNDARAPAAARLSVREGIALAAALTCVAGLVDTVGYIALYHVFTANMTGNTIAIARGMIEDDIGLALRRGFAIPMFVTGLVVSRLCVHVAAQRGWRRIAGTLFVLEAALLAGFVALGSDIPSGAAIEHEARYYVLVAFPSLAMGLQNAALTHFGPLTVRTTHVTGNLAKFADAVAQYLVWLRARIRAASLPRALAESRAQRSFGRALLLGGIWISYLAGAILGAYLYSRGGSRALLLPIACLLGLAALDAAHPILPFRR
jgi:uncharacterized membrane protein YoaK (UPF0700 family)